MKNHVSLDKVPVQLHEGETRKAKGKSIIGRQNVSFVYKALIDASSTYNYCTRIGILPGGAVALRRSTTC